MLLFRVEIVAYGIMSDACWSKNKKEDGRFNMYMLATLESLASPSRVLYNVTSLDNAVG